MISRSQKSCEGMCRCRDSASFLWSSKLWLIVDRMIMVDYPGLSRLSSVIHLQSFGIRNMAARACLEAIWYNLRVGPPWSIDDKTLVLYLIWATWTYLMHFDAPVPCGTPHSSVPPCHCKTAAAGSAVQGSRRRLELLEPLAWFELTLMGKCKLLVATLIILIGKPLQKKQLRLFKGSRSDIASLGKHFDTLCNIFQRGVELP